MITLQEALNKLINLQIETSIIEVELKNALGKVLAEDIFSDVDMPPFNKSAMDGFACKQSDLSLPLKVIDYIPAGILPKVKIESGQCSKIMTGAKVPEGANCVIMVEHTQSLSGNSIKFTGTATKSNICKLGEDVKLGDKVLSIGNVLNSASIGVAASVGKTTIHVYEPPTIAILATGDELFDIDKKPFGAFIRNSNSYNILAQIAQTPANANIIGIVSDTKTDIENAIISALEINDIIILTGGVSMGDKDYIPEILAKLGMEVIFDKLAIQPGKPVAFAYGNGKFCFGLSGNPVSSLLQFEVLTKPFIYFYMQNNYKLPFVNMKLISEKKRKKAERMQFFPIQLINGKAVPLEYHGSAHIAGLVKADGFATFEIGKNIIHANEDVKILIL